MKIAIQNTETGFHPKWIKYCQENGIGYKLVNCYSNDIIDQISDCDALMWHHHHSGVKDIIFAKQLLFAVEHAGKVVFPGLRTAWHFDDKVAQKYLLEAAGADLVPTWIFYDKIDATKWIEGTTFPKVFKLRGGAGSANVRLVIDKIYAKKLINQAFSSGFSQYNSLSNLKERFRKWRMGKGSLKKIAKGLVRFVMPPEYSKIKGRDRGYIYFQEFIPNNEFDIRVIVIGDKAIAIKRMVRKNDFRASGSGILEHRRNSIPESAIRVAFELVKKLKTQSSAIDFVFKDGKPLIVEMSYGFPLGEFVDNCPGYWNDKLIWHEGNYDPCVWMVESVLLDVERKRNKTI